MKKNHFCWENAFHYIWQNCDEDGIWAGGEAALAQEFDVSEEEAYSVLSDLCDGHLIERVGRVDYAVVRWPERDGACADEHL